MVRLVSAFVLSLSVAALAQSVSFNGDVVLVQDPTGALTGLVGTDNMTIFPSHQEQFCRAAFNAARAGGLADEFDGVITFSAAETLTDLDNVWQGSPVRADGTGYGRANSPSMTSYTSSKLGQCVFMGTLGRTTSLFGGQGPEALPSDPDAAWAPSLGIQLPGITSLTGIEMLGHEYGHHWLLGVEFDQNDGRGRQHFLRGYSGDGDNGQMGSPNQHYSHNADSRSVMYGECITDLGGGSFRFEGCARKYSQIDQYLMGLRGVNEVAPMMVLEDPTNPGKGVDSVAMGRTSSGMTVNGLTRHDIAADEIVRAMGARIPGYPNARNCWRVAFVVVLAPGQTTVPQAMLDKVNRYRARWSPWFYAATDGRGTMDSRLTGNGCLVMPGFDAGVSEADAGLSEPELDAGLAEADAGLDAGEPVTVPSDADAGTPPSKWDTYVANETGKIRPGCGCGAGGGEFLALLGLAVWFARRRS